MRHVIRRSLMIAFSAALLPVNSAPTHAQDTECAVPVDALVDPVLTPEQKDYRADLHSLATGRGVSVAIIDTGVFAHEQLPYLKAGPDFVTPEEPAALFDCDIHGTVVASIIGARDIGIAPHAKLLSIRQTSQHYRDSAESAGTDSEGTGSLASMAQAIDAAIDAGARVISLSVVACMTRDEAARLDSAGLQESLLRAERAGTVIVASAGNIDGDCEAGMVVYPAVEPTVITVAALENEYDIASYSLPVAVGDWVSAPGFAHIALHPRGEGWMRAARSGSGERTFHGTSYAAPLVSATVALMLERNPQLTPAQVRDVIYDSAQSANRVHDPLAALTHVATIKEPNTRQIAIDPAATADNPAGLRLVWLAGAIGIGGLIALFVAGIARNLLPTRARGLKQSPPATGE